MLQHPSRRGAGRRGLALTLLVASLAVVGHADAGHESPWYPSFYPQEIRIEAVDRGAARALLQRNSLHAYIGGDPFAGGTLPAGVTTVDSLGAYVVVSFNQASASLRGAHGRCAAGRRLLGRLAEFKDLFAFHPYPVTPFHGDYLTHFDLARAARPPAADPAAGGQGAGDPGLKIKAQGRLAGMLARAGWSAADQGWDAALEEVEVAALMGSRTVGMNGWLGPPWLKEGWFHAYLLLAGTIQDPARRQRLEAIYRRLVEGAYADAVEKANLERALVSQLTRGCERIVVGYTTRRTFLNDDFSHGVENVAVDSQAGPIAPIFPRTAKLKDSPWNGWLKVGMEAGPGPSAWNPIGGFADPFGRLLWSAVGDPALLPGPHGGTWIPNRVTATVAPAGPTPGKVEVPPDALLPEAGVGLFRAVGPGVAAKAKVTYTVPLSAFHDGTRMTAADLVYPYAFAARWGTRRGPDGTADDLSIEASTAILRQWLAGLKVVRVEQAVKTLADVKLEWQIPVIEVFLHHSLLDPQHAASAAPPWSSIPWHLLVLMEEGVTRGLAAFSQAEAERRGIPWLELVRDPGLHARLRSLAEEFERAAFVPEALKGFATAEEAKQRWAALRQFAQKHRHFLVTNGPYLLEKWSADSATLQVFRDFSYPVGLGTFDVYVHPPRAFIARAEVRGGRLRVAVEMEKAVRAQRSYRWVKGPLTKDADSGGYPVHAVGSYVALGPDGKVRAAARARFGDDATFTADLRSLPSGTYTLLVAVYLNGNQVQPEVKAIPYRAGR